MLRQLRVGNLALAADVAVSFAEGLTVLTGETGAGKSLIAGALALLAGGRAEKDLIRRGEELAFVEGVFDLATRPELCARAAAAGIRVGDDQVLVLRRELRREGRGRVLINGLVSSLALLEDIGGQLLVVQSQDQQRRLGQPTFATDFLDDALGLGELRTELAEALSRWRGLAVDLAARLREEEYAARQLDMWQYQLRELTDAALDPDEESRLGEQIALGRGARGLLEAAAEARQHLADAPANAEQLLGEAARHLTRVAGTSPRLDAVADVLADAQAAVADAARELERFLDAVEVDPARLDALEERKALYEDLQRKYNRDVSGLVAYLAELQDRIARQASAVSDVARLEAARNAACERVAELCLQLRNRREVGAVGVATRAAELIRPLALPDLELAFRVQPARADDGDLTVDGVVCRVGPRGADRVVLEARTNRGEAAADVGRIASGGERSRIYLGLAALGLGAGDVPVLLFDEIDAGLGMEGAVPVAALLRNLADRGQVICITHMPTVAARASQHLLVVKQARGDRTVIGVSELDPAARLEEVARLLGGDEAGERTQRLAYAAELLGLNSVRKAEA